MRDASIASIVAALGILTGCSKAPTPTAPTAPASVVAAPAVQTPVLRIIVPPAVPFGSTIPLRTEIRTGDSVTDCASSAASWKSSDGNIGVVGYLYDYGPPPFGPLTLFTRQSGFLTLTATCDGLTASERIRVEGTWLPTSITTTDDVLGVPTGSTIEILDGPRAGVRVPESQFSTVTGFTFPLTVRLTAPFYAAKDYALDHTGDPNSYAPGFEVHRGVQTSLQRQVGLTYVGEPSTDTFAARWRNNHESQDAAYPFAVRAAGTIEVGTQWQNDFDDQYTLITELWCGGQMLYRDTDVRLGPPPGVRFRQTVTGPAACEIRVHRINQAYRITVTYPH